MPGREGHWGYGHGWGGGWGFPGFGEVVVPEAVVFDPNAAVDPYAGMPMDDGTSPTDGQDYVPLLEAQVDVPVVVAPWGGDWGRTWGGGGPHFAGRPGRPVPHGAPPPHAAPAPHGAPPPHAAPAPGGHHHGAGFIPDYEMGFIPDYEMGYAAGFIPDYEMGFLPGYEMGFMPGYEMGVAPGYPEIVGVAPGYPEIVGQAGRGRTMCPDGRWVDNINGCFQHAQAPHGYAPPPHEYHHHPGYDPHHYGYGQGAPPPPQQYGAPPPPQPYGRVAPPYGQGAPPQPRLNTWTRWQQVHPGTSQQDYRNWVTQYGQYGATIM